MNFRKILSLSIISSLFFGTISTCFADSEGLKLMYESFDDESFDDESFDKIDLVTSDQMDSLIEKIEELKSENPDLSEEEIGFLLEEEINNGDRVNRSTNEDDVEDSYTKLKVFWKKRLSDAERSFIKKHPFAAASIKMAADTANSYTVSYFKNSRIGDSSDAYRHATWNILMCNSIGENLAREYGNAHEDPTGIDLNTPSWNSYGKNDGKTMRDHRNMDLHNNARGRSLYEKFYGGSAESMLAEKVYRDISKNKDKYIILYEY